MQTKIAVIGAGVIGLTSAIKLQEAGFLVTIFARDIYDNLTSRAAPAFFSPFRASPEDLILKWARQSLPYYKNGPSEAGIALLPYHEYHKEKTHPPLWASLVNDFVEMKQSDLPLSYAVGYTTHFYRADTSLYVDYLLEKFMRQNGVIVQQNLQKFENIPAQFSIIINCSGVWSSQLVADKENFPIRGQYILTEKPRSLNKIVFASFDDENFILIVPRTHDCYLGGTTLVGEWNTEVNPVTQENILKRTQEFLPELKDMKIHKSGVGLRPGRTRVRVETEITPYRAIIHNYGHGGSGFTIGWGCAEDVVVLVKQL